MNYFKKLTKRLLIFFSIIIIIICFLLFGTKYGHDFRLIVAESILTSQHPQYVKYTFLNKHELKKLSDQLNHPKWKNSNDNPDTNLIKYNYSKLKDSPLDINIETIESKENAKFPFKGKLVTVNNPFNVKLVTHQGSQGKDKGEKISVMAKRNQALVAINASGFNDETGKGGGSQATGIVIENGNFINSDHEMNEPALVAGLTKFGQLITGNYSAKDLLNMQVISAAGFMPQLIVNGERMIIEGDGGWGSGPRSIMAQKKDGSIMFLVIDGRQAHSIGATLKECQEILLEKGAINAMAMDGGSSATLYLLGNIENSPSTLSHKDRYLPNAWIINANPKQDIHMTMDGKKLDTKNVCS
ncbi:phosphodiester glycosidase family protein [Bacillus cereus]|uniref:phosphodiester glycosidase family protein n=1 Tax=Bacillus cereus TaxID=1396 RepID=UPI0009953CE9|nr:phosphodiester glycosidase family protein [Bacillus cereus]MCU4733468.1 phosphodiester glycosidase family protein [Bacillus cereus]OPA11475.1 branched-chain amino acid ABC transporter permease [Bacillus cereus]HDR7761420.1 phosphodiester glycosidase family protein [Bacillus cereus]